MNQYNELEMLIHEERAEDGERLDHYLARIRPQIGDQEFWYKECDAGRVEVRDHYSLALGMYSREHWFIRWFDGKNWRTMNLPEGERPRMRYGFCHIVKE